MKKILLNLIYLFIALIFVSCAKIGTPTGGPYDREAPKQRKSSPENNSTNFKSNGFEIEFDEYIELSNTSEELIISPPLKNKPNIKSHLKKLKVSWTDTLAENTTYIFDFGNSIIDFTEGNRVNNFTYSFSTGDYIDTMEYRGVVKQAYTLNNVKGKYVMLYKSEDRDIVRKEKPNYITRTDSLGRFLFKNIAEGDYQIMVLDDKNQNLLYDLPTEGLAFSNTRVSATNYTKPKEDTINQFLISPKPKQIDNILYFVEPKDSLINLLSSKLISPHHLQLVFSNPITDSLNMSFIFPPVNIKDSSKLFVQHNSNKDTLDIWSMEHRFDSLKLEIKDISLKELIELYYVKPRKEIIKESFSFIIPKQPLPYFSELLLKLPFPIHKDSAYFKAISIKDNDTLQIDCTPYDLSPLFVKINHKFEQGSTQRIKIEQGVVRNRLSQVNDSISFDLTLDSESDYGNLYLNIEDSLFEGSNYILILEDLKQNPIKTIFASDKEKVKFSNLKDGNYKIRLILDVNKNKKWDYGNYDQNILPEKIIYYNKPINIRKNWDLEETWVIKKE